MKNKLTIPLILGAIAIIAAGFWFSQKPGADGKSTTPGTATIQIAANLPMSGPLATYGVPVREGANMALEEAPASGDAAAPKIVVDWQDNTGDPKTTVSILQKQALAHPNIYISGVKPQTMAIKDEVSKQGMPHFVWIFDTKINAETKNNFRTWVSFKIEPQVHLDYAKKIGAKKIVIAYVQLPHTIEAYEKILAPKLKEQGASEVIVESYEIGRTDFKDLALKISKANPDLIILNGFQNDMVGMIRSLRPLNAIKEGNFVASYDLLDAAKVLGADEMEGLRVVAPLFETRPESPVIADWKKRFNTKYGRAPLYTHAFAYDMVKAIRTASTNLKHPATNQQWIDALRLVDVPGVTGPIRFDADGDMVTPVEIGVYHGGKLVPDASAK